MLVVSKICVINASEMVKRFMEVTPFQKFLAPETKLLFEMGALQRSR